MGVPLSAAGGSALDSLFARTTGAIKPGLDRTLALLERMGDPHRRLRCLHIAGTNGKGSVAAMAEALLHHRGLSVGLFTSPHLVDFRERFVINGRAIPESDVQAFLERWMPDVEELDATFFEATTALAFDVFVRAEVDVAVVETGLGGRLDSTNVILPIVAGVTTIGLEHAEWLGSTLPEIAREKAGIFKAGAPAVIGEPDPAMAALLAGFAAGHGASPVRLVEQETRPADVTLDRTGTHFRIFPPGGRDSETVALSTPLTGAHQAGNAAMALTLLHAAGAEFLPPVAEWNAALAQTRLPGRFQREGKWILDVAHNPHGAQALAATLAAVDAPRPLVLVMAVLSDKDWRGMLEELAPLADVTVLTEASGVPAGRRWDVVAAGEHAAARGWPVRVIRELDAALHFADENGATVLVTGSFHTVGDAMSRLQLSPLRG